MCTLDTLPNRFGSDSALHSESLNWGQNIWYRIFGKICGLADHNFSTSSKDISTVCVQSPERTIQTGALSANQREFAMLALPLYILLFPFELLCGLGSQERPSKL
jgi:hypothetical protein